jgi:hypothetical protein
MRVFTVTEPFEHRPVTQVSPAGFNSLFFAGYVLHD